MIIGMEREETEEERFERLSKYEFDFGKPKSEWDSLDWEYFTAFYVDEGGYA